MFIIRPQRLASARLPAASMPCIAEFPTCCLQLPLLLSCATALCSFWLSYFWCHRSWLLVTVSHLSVRLCWRLKSSPGGHTLKSRLCPSCRTNECLVLIPLTAESPLESLLPQRRDSCFTTQPVLWVEQYLHNICFPALGVSPSASYNFSSKAGSASDFLTGKVPSLSKYHRWRPSL